MATCMWEMARDCTVYELDSVLIVEVMGRDTGWLTASAALPRLHGCDAPHLVYLPEVSFTADQFIADVCEAQKHTRTVIVAVSEGVELEGLDDFQSGKVDNFGHKYLSGIGKCLEELVRDRTVLLDFWAPWCGPCRMVAPILDEIAAEREDITVGKVNVDEQMALARQFKVMSIPTLVVMRNGQVVKKTTGALPKEEILDLLK